MTTESPNTPAARAKRIKTAFEAKVALLETWAREGPPADAEVPRNLTALRAWTGPAGTFATWSDPLVDRPGKGKYPDLTERYQNAVKTIAQRQKRRRASVRDTIALLAWHEERNEALVRQNAELIGRLATLEQRARQTEDRLRGQLSECQAKLQLVEEAKPPRSDAGGL